MSRTQEPTEAQATDRWRIHLRWSIRLGLAVLIGVLFLFDPEAGGGYPTCPFRSLTGWLCPGCGSQRAAHDLLHLRLGEAWEHNAALVAALPLLGLQVFLGRGRPWYSGSGQRMVLAWTFAVIAWGVVRNIPGFELSGS